MDCVITNSTNIYETNILGALNLGMLTIIMSFLFVNLFDTTGTLFGVAEANLISNDEHSDELNKALKADSSASIFEHFLVVLLSQVM